MGFDASRWLEPKALRHTGLATQYGYAAAIEAWAAAGLDRRDRPRAGVYLGTALGGIAVMEAGYVGLHTIPGNRPKPGTIPMSIANAPAALLASRFRLLGPNLTFSVACASASHAIGHAYRELCRGELDLVLAGGVEAPLCRGVLQAWSSMRILAHAGADPRRSCRPFSADREGLVLGEGGAMLVLETLEHARARQAPIRAEILGYAATADAGESVQPDRAGVESCLRLALADAGVECRQVGYVNAHGTGTSASDRVEAEALGAVFQEQAASLAISSTKAAHGHALGASGALEAIATVLALEDGRLPPTANLEHADPALPALDHIVGEARKSSVDLALSNSFAFGGNNAVLVMARV
jgi:3-oxoacyl-(acyl-carrier-protein) synthase